MGMERVGTKTAEPLAAKADARMAAFSPGVNDQDLLRELRGPGAEAALTALLQRYGSLVLRAAKRVTGDEHRAEDVLQAVFLILYQKAAALGAVGSLGGWLYRTTVLAAREAVRAEARRRRREEAVAKSAEARTEDVPLELPAGFDAALERLPAGYRDVIVLRYLRGMSLEEAATELNVTPGTVATRTSRGIDRLRKALGASVGAYAGAALLDALSAEGAQAASATLHASNLASVTAVCLKGVGTAGGGVALAKAVKVSLLVSKVKLGLACVALLATASIVTISLSLREEDDPPAAVEQVPGATIRFEPDAAASSQLTTAMANWQAEERERQGGRLAGSHAWWPWGLQVFDADSDGRQDLLVTHMGTPGTRIFRNVSTADGFVFEPAILSGAALAGTFPPEVVDLNGDGFSDLVFNAAGKANCFLNMRGKGFEALPFRMPEHETFQRVGVEEAGGAAYMIGDRTYYRYDAAAKTFRTSPWTNPIETRVPAQVAERIARERANPAQRMLRIRWRDDVDLNGDGRADVICAGFASYQSSSFGCYLVSDAQGNLLDATDEWGLPSAGVAVFAGDLCGDGRVYVVISHGPAPGCYRWNGTRYERIPGELTERLKRKYESPHRILQTDFNADGRPDLLLHAGRWNAAIVFENHGDGTFREAFRLPVWTGDAVCVADMNADGRPDLIAGGPGDRVNLYLNRSGVGSAKTK